MTDTAKIQGQKLKELLRHLIEKKTIVSIKLQGIDYERLTYMVDAEESNGQCYLIIDLPEGFHKVSERAAPWKMDFNFNGPDKLEYLFSVTGGEFHPAGLRIPCPDQVDRIQRRKNFRIMTPLGTRMAITAPPLKGLMDIINISLGGVYGTLNKHNLKNAREPLLTVNQWTECLGIIFPADNEMDEQIVVINKAQVRRIDHDLEKGVYKYAFEFMDIASEQYQKLVRCIYHIQRQFLVRR